MKLSSSINNKIGRAGVTYRKVAIVLLEMWRDHAFQLEAKADEYHAQYHLAEAKVLSRDAIIEQLSETELAQRVTQLEAENERLKRPCIGCDSALADCYDWKRDGRVACCPDCRHDPQDQSHD